MGRPFGLRTRASKERIDAMRKSVMYSYARNEISESRMLMLNGLLDSFEREAFLPHRKIQEEKNAELAERIGKGY